MERSVANENSGQSRPSVAATYYSLRETVAVTVASTITDLNIIWTNVAVKTAESENN